MLGEALADPVRHWSVKWFATGAVSVLSAVPESGSGGRDAAAWHRDTHDIELRLVPSAATDLACRMLDHRIEDKTLRPADRQLIAQLTAACLDDLRSTVCRAFGSDIAEPWREGSLARSDEAGVELRLAWRHGPQLATVWIGMALAVACRKSRCGAGRSDTGLGRSDDALASVELSLSANLGSGALTLAELQALDEGDVLVLERALDETLPLLVNGRTAGRAACRIVERERGFALELSEAVHRS